MNRADNFDNRRDREKAKRLMTQRAVDAKCRVARPDALHRKAAAETARAQGLVLTPGGFRHPSKVRRVQAGEVLRPTGNSRGVDLTPHSASEISASAREPFPGLNPGWITGAIFNSYAAYPSTISRLTTTWKVPPAPAVQEGQSIYLYGALMDAEQNNILQPVLQWGTSGAGGNPNGWTVVCWYIDPGGNATFTDPVAVAEGDILVGIMTGTRPASGGNIQNYECYFQGIGGVRLAAEGLDPLTVATETLECYGIESCGDYPATFYTAMTGIQLEIDDIATQPDWQVENIVTECGQHTAIVSTSATGGEIDLFYSSQAPGWHLQRLTAGTALTAGPASASAPTAGVFMNQQHIAYVDQDELMWDSWYDGATQKWNLQRIESVGLEGYGDQTYGLGSPTIWVYEQQLHFTFVANGTDATWDTWYDNVTGKWNSQTVSGPSGPYSFGTPSVAVFGQQQHFILYDNDFGYVNDLWYDGVTGKWNNQLINLQTVPYSGGITAGNAATGPASVSVFGNQMHVAYRDSGGLIWDSWYDGATGAWNLQTMNAFGRTTGPLASSNPTVSTFQQQQHFVYIDSLGVLWDAWYDGVANKWGLQQINAGGLTNGPAAVSDPVISVFGRQQHFCYLDGRGAIWDSWYDGVSNQWNLQQINLSGLTNGPAAVGPDRVGFFTGLILIPPQRHFAVWVYNDQQHFTYFDVNGIVWDSWYDGVNGEWNLQQINSASLTQGAVAASDPVPSVFGEQWHVAYLDSNGIIWDAWYDGLASWNLQQINGADGRTAGNPAVGGLAISTFGDQQHFAYRDFNRTLRDAWYDGPASQWNLQQINLSGLTGGPAVFNGPFVSVFGDQQHFTYVDEIGTIWDSWYDLAVGSWTFQPINGADGRTKGVAAAGGCFVSAFGTGQHFTYRDSSGTIWDAGHDAPSDTWTLHLINNGGATKAPAAAGDIFVLGFGQQQHFAYSDSAGTIWDVFFDAVSSSWTVQQINAGGVTNGPPAADSPCLFSSVSQLHFVYVTGDGTLWDALFDGTSGDWSLRQINLGGNGLGLTSGPAVVGNAVGCLYQSQQHFTYRGPDGAIWDAWFEG
jgi:hypothetical protein